MRKTELLEDQALSTRLKVEAITLREIRMPLVHFFETSFGRTYSRRILLVTVHCDGVDGWAESDRKSTRHSSHSQISYAVFCLQKKKLAFLDAIDPRNERAVLLTQLPVSFSPTDFSALGRFLRLLPADRRRAVTVRHPGITTTTV